MKELAVRAGIALLLNAIALWVTALLLSKVTIDGIGFVFAVVLFTIAALVSRPIVRALVKEYASWATLAVAVITTFIALLIADLISDDFNIEGILTWVWATLIVWVVSLILEFVTPSRGPSGN
jgi:putative membrane protein